MSPIVFGIALVRVLIENRIYPRWFNGRDFNESTTCRYTDRVKEANKEWEGTQRLATGAAVTTLELRGQGGVESLSHSESWKVAQLVELYCMGHNY